MYPEMNFMELMPLIVTTVSFIYGIAKLFKKKIPLYFLLAVCSVGCFALEELYSILCRVCIGSNINGLSLGSLGYAGSLSFLLVANVGAFDSIFSDNGANTKKSRMRALIAPAVLTAVFAAMLVCCEMRTAEIIVSVVLFIAAIPCSYYNLKMILLDAKDDPFLRAVKPQNIVSLVFCCATVSMLVFYNAEISSAYTASVAAMTISAAGLVITADWGRKQWLIK